VLFHVTIIFFDELIIMALLIDYRVSQNCFCNPITEPSGIQIAVIKKDCQTKGLSHEELK